MRVLSHGLNQVPNSVWLSDINRDNVAAGPYVNRAGEVPDASRALTEDRKSYAVPTLLQERISVSAVATALARLGSRKGAFLESIRHSC
jgi:hypothetical protein